MAAYRVGTPKLGLALLVCVGAYGPVRVVSAQEESLPRVAILSRSDFVEALQGPPNPDDSRVRFALLATQGQTILPMLRAIIEDPAQTLVTRANALGVAALLPDRSMVKLIVDLARPGPLQAAAYNALVLSPFPEACALWRTILRDPDQYPTAGGMALSGIGFCGTESDIPLVEASIRNRTFGARETAQWSIRRLRLPMADRYRGTRLEGNYPPSAAYRPPPALAAEIRTQVCGGVCPVGLVVEAKDLPRR